jgi:hypothetical protein
VVFLRSLVGRSPEPDLKFAAKGYVQVAVTRRYAPHVDLHRLEQSYAGELLAEGCTREQALSARWGGAYAAASEAAAFDDVLAAYKDVVAERGQGHGWTKDDAARMYEGAGLLLMTSAHAADPYEYGRFLRHIAA